MHEVYEFLKKCNVYYLATVEGDQPRVRPFGTVDIFEGKLYIQTGKQKPVAHQMKANPKVELSGMAEGKWIRVTAEAVLDERLAPQEHMLAAYPMLQGMYSAEDDNTEVLYFENASATFASFGGAPRTVTF